MITVLKAIFYVLLFTTLFYGLYFIISGYIGIIFKNKVKFKKSEKKSKFAIIVPARNEGLVIGNMIKSLEGLNYPRDKYEVFVVPNNCTDNTKEIAMKNGANIIECNVPTKTKGDVMRVAFKELADRKDIDAYLIFDADNLVHRDFLNHMNDCLNSGYRVAEGCRDAKNPSDNWISGSYTIFYIFQNVFFNRARMGINGGSSSINGTGFMISKELIDERGFETFTLTEDCEFTGQCALMGEKVAYVDDAITYDEYPDKFMASCKQRRRWSAGVIQCMKLYSLRLLKHAFKTGNFASFDMSLVYMGPLMQVLSILNTGILVAFFAFGIKLNDIVTTFFASGVLFGAVLFGISLVVEIFAIKYKKKDVKSLWAGIILFAFFIFTWLPINVLCFAKKYNKWEEIKHTKSLSIEDINAGISPVASPDLMTQPVMGAQPSAVTAATEVKTQAYGSYKHNSF